MVKLRKKQKIAVVQPCERGSAAVWHQTVFADFGQRFGFGVIPEGVGRTFYTEIGQAKFAFIGRDGNGGKAAACIDFRFTAVGSTERQCVMGVIRLCVCIISYGQPAAVF